MIDDVEGKLLKKAMVKAKKFFKTIGKYVMKAIKLLKNTYCMKNKSMIMTYPLSCNILFCLVKCFGIFVKIMTKVLKIAAIFGK